MRISEEPDEPVPEGWKKRMKDITVALPQSITSEHSPEAYELAKKTFEDTFPPPTWQFKACFAVRNWMSAGKNQVTYRVICWEKIPKPAKSPHA